MTRDEFIQELDQRLKRLSADEKQDAIEYYHEYFEEAGPEKEQQVIAELGTPKQLAAQILAQVAVRRSTEDPQNGKKSFHAVWMSIGAIFAAPIAVPVALALAIVAIAVVISLIALFISFFAVSLALAVTGLFVLVGGISLLSSALPTGLLALGMALASSGLSMLIFVPTLLLSRACFRGIAGLVNKWILRREMK